MQRVACYIDGFNLYFGLKSKGWRKYYWLDLVAMSQAMLKPGQHLEHCHYFTARVSSGGQSQSSRRQLVWLEALATRDRLTTHFGHYLPNEIQCRNCGSSWIKPEEKMTDVNIATQMLTDAYESRFDVAMVISGDSDLAPPIECIRKRFPEKRVLVAFPPNRSSAQLKQIAHGWWFIGEDKLRKNLLPTPLLSAGGYPIHRPAEWY